MADPPQDLEGPCLATALSCLPPSLPLCTLKVAQVDAGGPELAWGGSAGAEEARGLLRRPTRSASPHQGVSPPRACSPDTPDPTLQAVQTAFGRRRLQEQVGSHGAVHRGPLPGLPMAYPGPDTPQAPGREAGVPARGAKGL